MGPSNTQLYQNTYLTDSSEKQDSARFHSYCFICCIISAVRFFSIMNLRICRLFSNESCAYEELKRLRLRNPKKVILVHLNINSLPNKFDGLMDLVKEKIDIFMISEN